MRSALRPHIGGRAYFDNYHLVCLVSVHKPVVRDCLKFKNRLLLMRKEGQTEDRL